jgi:murein DD-endopeptidase MepM/ murein hydrolase activator NlpD
MTGAKKRAAVASLLIAVMIWEPGQAADGLLGNNPVGGSFGFGVFGGLLMGRMGGGGYRSGSRSRHSRNPVADQPSIDKPIEDLVSIRWPVVGRLVKRFEHGAWDGIDIVAAAGNPVRAADDGVVIAAGDGSKGFGNLVLIRHAGNAITAYSNFGELKVEEGQQVDRGQVIANLRRTASGAGQLHFELLLNTQPVDPVPLLQSR